MPQAPSSSQRSTQDPSPTLPQKMVLLRQILQEMGSVLVCFSGGIDSAFLLAVANEELGENAVGMTAISPSLPVREKEAATQIASELGANHQLVQSNEIARPDYVKNGADRCFHCKTELYSIAENKRKEWRLNYVANGTNKDDLGDYRPGLRAAAEANVRSPFVDAGFDKEDVRAGAQLLGMKIWDKPAAACLSSRIPYGVAVTRERLAQVEGLEDAIRALGFKQVRVRYHDSIARIEVPLCDMPRIVEGETNKKIVEAGKQNGFQFITIDLAGYRTGSLNELLQGRTLKVLRNQ